jgi:hypothetical protein
MSGKESKTTHPQMKMMERMKRRRAAEPRAESGKESKTTHPQMKMMERMKRRKATTRQKARIVPGPGSVTSRRPNGAEQKSPGRCPGLSCRAPSGRKSYADTSSFLTVTFVAL